MRASRGWMGLVSAAFLSLPAPVAAGNGVSLGSTSAYGNLHAGGVVATVAGDDDRDASVALEWRVAGGSFRSGHPLTRIDAAHFLRNVAYGIGNTRTSQLDGYTASALKINSGYPTPVGPLLVYHNTFLTEAAGTDAIALLQPGESTFIRARNNVVAGTRYALDKVNAVSWSGDGDLLYTTSTSRFVSWEGTRHDTLAAFRSGTSGPRPRAFSSTGRWCFPASTTRSRARGRTSARSRPTASESRSTTGRSRRGAPRTRPFG